MTKIDIYSGFLGAGKTTLIKKLISEGYKGQKLVLIENEFGEIGIDGGFVMALMSGGTFNVILTILICLVKGTMAGFVSSLLFKIISKKNVVLATIISALVAPIGNTGLFILGALGLTNVIGAMASSNGMSVIYFLIIGCAGFNFLFEFGTTLIFAPSLTRVVKALGIKTADELSETETEDEGESENASRD